MKEERLRRKERKMRRKAKLESECLAEKMNCFNHDNQHWRTPPFWTGSLNVFYNSLGKFKFFVRLYEYKQQKITMKMLLLLFLRLSLCY